MRKKRIFTFSPGGVTRFWVFLLIIALVGISGVSALLWPATAGAQGSQNGVLHRHDPRVQEAIGIQDKHLWRLMRIPGVVGMGVGIGAEGEPVIRVFTARPEIQGIPEWLESVPVQVQVTGMVVAQGDTTARYRPAPIGVSTGHPAITAGTIGARVTDGTNFFALSNNHVYANQNYASEGDSVLQPGSSDGGTFPGDEIGTLYDFERIDFTLSGVNYIDAAIAISSKENLANSTLPDGYGTPDSTITAAFVGLLVKKYGRTTGLTHGTVSGINVFVEVCYEQFWFLCVKSAYFDDQIAVSPPAPSTEFSAGGDSGSLIVTENGNNPVGLLFAGGTNITFANRIDLVLDRFNVSIDDSTEPAPLSAPSNLTANVASVNQIKLAWTDNSDGEEGFEIERCQGTGCINFTRIAGVGPNVTTYSDSGLSPETAYAYRVRAYKASENSAYSNIARATTTLKPAAPSNLIASVSGRTKVVLTWFDNANNEDGFKIERCQGSGCTNFTRIATAKKNATSYTDTTVRRRTAYRYRIQAYNSEGNSPYSNIAEALTY